MRTLLVLLCAAASGCSVSLHGYQSGSGGSVTTATSGQVAASARFSGGTVAFGSGRVPPAGAPGGHVHLGKGAAAVLLTGVVLADFFSHLASAPKPKPLPAGERILETCSCYKKEVTSDE
jgi:hypothetical protein